MIDDEHGDSEGELEGELEEAADRRRASSRTSRKLALLRAHGLIKKIPHAHRYELTTSGRTTITALLVQFSDNTSAI